MRSTIEDVNYFNDRRVRVRDRGPWYISTGCPSGSSTEGHPTHVAVQVPTADYRWLVDHGYDADEGPVRPDDEDRVYVPFRVVAFPCRWVECPTCDGRGHHVNPSIDAGGLTRSDFDEDPDFEEGYFGGRYDVTCYECRGRRVVPTVDVHALAPEERRDYETWAAWRGELAGDEAAYRAERMAEMRMGY